MEERGKEEGKRKRERVKDTDVKNSL